MKPIRRLWDLLIGNLHQVLYNTQDLVDDVRARLNTHGQLHIEHAGRIDAHRERLASIQGFVFDLANGLKMAGPVVINTAEKVAEMDSTVDALVHANNENTAHLVQVFEVLELMSDRLIAAEKRLERQALAIRMISAAVVSERHEARKDRQAFAGYEDDTKAILAHHSRRIDHVARLVRDIANARTVQGLRGIWKALKHAEKCPKCSGFSNCREYIDLYEEAVSARIASGVIEEDSNVPF